MTSKIYTMQITYELHALMIILRNINDLIRH